MENKDSEISDNRRDESDASFSSQDWDILDEADIKEAIGDKSYHNYDGVENNHKHDDNAELNISKSANIRRRHVASSRQRVEEIDSNEFEDSDGVSVITDTETDLSVVNSSVILQTATTTKIFKNWWQRNESFDTQLTLKVGVIEIIAIACLLGATLIFGTVCILNLYDGHMLKGNELESIDKMKSALLQLNENILATTKFYENVLQERTKDVFHVLADYQAPREIFATSSIDPTMNSLEQLHTFYNTLCSIITKLHEGKHIAKEQVCMSSNIVLDLINFKKRIHTLLDELKDTDKFLEKSFLYRTEVKISTAGEFLILDLSNTIQTLMTTISEKLYDEKNNLNKKLCAIQSEIIADTEFSKTFGKVTTFLNSCTRSSNITFSTPEFSIHTQNEYNKFSHDAIKLLSEKNSGSNIFQEIDSCEIGRQINNSFESQIKRNKTLHNKVTDKKGKKDFLEQGATKNYNKKYRQEKNNDNQKKSTLIHESKDRNNNKKITNGEKENKNSCNKVEKVKHSENLKHGPFKEDSKHKKQRFKKNVNNEFNGSWQFQRSHGRDKFRNCGSESSYSNKNWFLQRASSRFQARKKLDNVNIRHCF